jgi:hypothetical protein
MQQGLLGWIVSLTISMFIWVIFMVVEFGIVVSPRLDAVPPNSFYIAASWIMDVFQAASFIILIFVAKARALSPNTSADSQPAMYTNTTYEGGLAYAQVPQGQYTYGNTYPVQQHQYNQQPVYGGPAPIHEVK